MKKIIFAIFMLIASASFTQQLSLTYSNEFPKNKIKNRLYPYKKMFFSCDLSYKTAFYSVNLTNATHSIEFTTYDENLKEIKTGSFENNEKVFGPYRSEIFVLNDNIYIFYSKKNEAKDSLTLYLSKINFETFLLEDTKILNTLAMSNYDARVGIFNEKKVKSFASQIIYNDNHSSVLLTAFTPNFLFSCILNNADAVIQKTASIPPKFTDFEINDIAFDENGNKYFSYNYTDNGKNAQGVLMQDKNGKDKFEKLNLNRQDLLPNTLSFAISRDKNKIYAFGNYYNNNIYLNEGVFIIQINTNTLQFDNSKVEVIPYPEDVIDALFKGHLGIKYKGKAAVRPIDYKLTEMDNNELSFYGLPQYTDNAYANQITTYIGPIVQLSKINGVYKYSFIPRSEEDETLNIKAIPVGNKIVYIQNEEKSNLIKWLKNNDEIKKYNKLVLVAKSINTNGECVIDILGENAKSDYTHVFYQTVKTGKNKYFIPLKDGNKFYKYVIFEVK